MILLVSWPLGGLSGGPRTTVEVSEKMGMGKIEVKPASCVSYESSERFDPKAYSHGTQERAKGISHLLENPIKNSSDSSGLALEEGDGHGH